MGTILQLLTAQVLARVLIYQRKAVQAYKSVLHFWSHKRERLTRLVSTEQIVQNKTRSATSLCFEQNSMCNHSLMFSIVMLTVAIFQQKASKLTK